MKKLNVFVVLILVIVSMSGLQNVFGVTILKNNLVLINPRQKMQVYYYADLSKSNVDLGKTVVLDSEKIKKNVGFAINIGTKSFTNFDASKFKSGEYLVSALIKDVVIGDNNETVELEVVGNEYSLKSVKGHYYKFQLVLFNKDKNHTIFSKEKIIPFYKMKDFKKRYLDVDMYEVSLKKKEEPFVPCRFSDFFDEEYD